MIRLELTMNATVTIKEMATEKFLRSSLKKNVTEMPVRRICTQRMAVLALSKHFWKTTCV